MKEFLKAVKGKDIYEVPFLMTEHNIGWVDIQAHILRTQNVLIMRCGELAEAIVK